MRNAAIKNYLHKTSWRMDIPDGGKTRSFQLTAQETMLPTMTLETATVALNPMLQGTIPGSAVTFEPVSVRVLLDEYMESYTELYQWMMSAVDYKGNGCSEKKNMPPLMMIHVIDNSKREIVCTFKFIEPFPVSMGTIDFSYSEDGNMAMATEVQIAYKWMEIEVEGKTIKPYTPSENNPTRGMHPSLRR